MQVDGTVNPVRKRDVFGAACTVITLESYHRGMFRGALLATHNCTSGIPGPYKRITPVRIRFKKLLWCVATARKSQKSKNSQGALSGLITALYPTTTAHDNGGCPILFFDSASATSRARSNLTTALYPLQQFSHCFMPHRCGQR
jgi:hypothetical protein